MPIPAEFQNLSGTFFVDADGVRYAATTADYHKDDVTVSYYTSLRGEITGMGKMSGYEWVLRKKCAAVKVA